MKSAGISITAGELHKGCENEKSLLAAERNTLLQQIEFELWPSHFKAGSTKSSF